MNSILLAVIGSEQERRNAPAVRALQRFSGKDDTLPEIHPKFLRRFVNHVGEVGRAARLAMALKRYGGKKIALPGKGHKFEEVRAELVEAGVPDSEIENICVESGAGLGLPGSFGMAYWLVRAVVLRAFLVIRVSARAKPYGNVIFNYAYVSLVLRKFQSRPYWCIIGDLSPFLIAFAGAVRAEKHNLITWQYGFQDFKHFPARPDIAIVLNRFGLGVARAKDPDLPVPGYRRKTQRHRNVHFSNPRKNLIGVALNAFSRADIVSQLKALQHHLASKIVVRPHPRDTQLYGMETSTLIQIDSSGPLEDFCSSVDWIICGNTTSALKIRALGVPVCQYFGFDLFFPDHFGYRRMGIMPAFEAIDQINLRTLQEFYSNNGPESALDALLGEDIVNDLPPLSVLAKDFGFALNE